MKSTGIVRKVDELGRIVLPKELRNTLEIKEKDPLEIFVDEDKIILRKYTPRDVEVDEIKYDLKVLINSEQDSLKREVLERALELLK